MDHPIRDLYQAPPTNMSQKNSANKSAEFLFMNQSETSKMTQMSQTPAKMSQETSRPIRSLESDRSTRLTYPQHEVQQLDYL